MKNYWGLLLFISALMSVALNCLFLFASEAQAAKEASVTVMPIGNDGVGCEIFSVRTTGLDVGHKDHLYVHCAGGTVAGLP